MSKINDLIKQYCPNGVLYAELGEIGVLYGGLTGKTKGDFADGNARFITYMNIFNNITVNPYDTGFVKVDEHERQTRVRVGDVLFTGSSETPNECGMSSVLTRTPDEPLYLNSFCFGFRPNDASLFLPDFSKHLFRDKMMRDQITKSVSGVTRFNISKKRFIKIVVPVPPIEVQQEIANTLDRFVSLEAELAAELEAELKARKVQYEHYRNLLINSNEAESQVKELGEVATFKYGFTTRAKDSGKYRFLRITDITEGGMLNADNAKYVDDSEVDEKYLTKKDDVLVARTGATYGKTLYIDSDINAVFASFLIRIDIDKTILLPRYYWHFTKSNYYWSQANNLMSGGGQPQFNANALKKVKVPIPSLEAQNHIVSILDKFDKLVVGMSTDLSAELNARQRQYIYYQNKLLTFQELPA